MNAPPVARMVYRALVCTVLPATLAGLVAPAPSHAAPPSVATRTITLYTSHPSFPRAIPAGLLDIRIVSDAWPGVGASVARIHPGVTLPQLQRASTNFMAVTRLVTFLGGLDVPVGAHARMVIDARTPGSYVLHLMPRDTGAGRALFFSVKPAIAQAVTPPRATVSVTMQGTRFLGLPAALHHGGISFKVTNNTSWVRKMEFFRLDPGKTLADFVAARQRNQEPGWARGSGGVDVLSGHQTFWLRLALAPGTYVADCSIPDPDHAGRPFDLEGMIAQVTVS